MKKMLSLPYTFVMLNLAALVAFYYFITNKGNVWVKNQTLPITDNKIIKQLSLQSAKKG